MGFILWDAFYFFHKTEISRDRHLQIQRGVLRQVTDAAPYIQGIVEDVISIHPHRSFGCRHVSGNDSHGGGLTGPVWTEKSKDLAFLHLERHPLDSRFCGVP